MLRQQAFNTLQQLVLSKEMAVALGFACCLTLLETFSLSITLRPYVLFLQQHQYFSAISGLFIILGFWIWAVLFFRVSLDSKYPIKILCVILFILAEFLEYGYQNAFGHFATVEDFRIALFDANNEQRLNSIRIYMDWRAAIPCLAYGLLFWRFRLRRSYSWQGITAIILALVCFFSLVSPYTTGQFPTISFNAFLRTAILSPWKWSSGYHGPRETINFHSPKQPSNNVVFIIDESIRGDHLSINGYSRHTTPYLEELLKQGLLHNAGLTASGATCSEKSDSLLLTGMTISELPDTNYEIRQRASIFEYARAMGYQTHFFDGQKETYWLGTSFDTTYLDEWKPASSFSAIDDFDRDKVIAQKISEVVRASTGHFIWVIKRGVHFPYTTSFPTTSAEWQPSDTVESAINPETREQLINTYDNAVRYNLESFFRALDMQSWPTNTTILYTSDHGQTLSEHGERHTHCGTSLDTAPSEANVPLFVIARDGKSFDSGFRASHANIFSSLLDLMDLPKSARLRGYPVSLFEATAADSQPRYFWVGDLFEKAENGKVLFDR